MKAASKNKYRAKRSYCLADHLHDSGREAKRCNELHLLQRAGQITDLTIQPHYHFDIEGRPLKGKNGHRLGFTADFEYREGGRTIAEDSKGFVVRDYPLRSALFRALFPHIELREV